MSWATTDLYDEHEGKVQTCSVQFHDFGGRKQFCGPIRTVRCFRDNQLFRALLDEPGDGAVVMDDNLRLPWCPPSRQGNGSPCGQFRARPEVGCGALPADRRPG